MQPPSRAPLLHPVSLYEQSRSFWITEITGNYACTWLHDILLTANLVT